jgi:hypothetical protein
MKLENQTILIFSNEPWGDVWYSKHNWAFELSKKNKVFFINPPSKWKLSNLWRFKIHIEDYNESLHVLVYQNLLPFTRFNLIYKLNNFFISKRIQKWLINNNYKKYIFWTFDPYRFSNPKLISPLFSIYFIADKYDLKRELTLVNNTDYFITVSKKITDLLPINNPLILSHGISSSEFISNLPVEIEGNYILYIGNIDYRLDYEFIKLLLYKFPKEQFLFIGNIIPLANNKLFEDIFIEKRYPNLIYQPAIHFKELKNYIYKAKVCIAPMLLEVNGNNINHHKLLQYLALGKPVLAPQFTDYRNNNLIYSYNDHEDGIKQLEKLLNDKERQSLIDERIKFAKQYTYEKLIKKVEQFLDKGIE